MEYLVIINNGIEAENYYFKNKKNAIKTYKDFKKYITKDVEIYKIKEIKEIGEKNERFKKPNNNN